jgi:hypothetical protein
MNKKHIISSAFILIIFIFLLRIFSKNRKIETFEEDKTTTPPPPPQEPPQPSQQQQSPPTPPLPPIDPNEGKKEVNLDTVDKKLDLIINHFDIRTP